MSPTTREAEAAKWPKPKSEWTVRASMYRPARAVTVYFLMAVLALAFILGCVAFTILYHRTQAVCQPLRLGQQQLHQNGMTQAAQDAARTFGGAANSLGCGR